MTSASTEMAAPPSEAQLKQEGSKLEQTIAEIRAMKNSPYRAKLATDLLIQLGAELEKRIHAEFDPACEKTYAAWKDATERRAKFLEYPLNAIKTGKQIAEEWLLESNRREEESRRQQEAAQLAEQKRQQEETAKHLEAQGQPEAAAEVRQEPLVPVALPVDKSAGRVAGLQKTALVYKLDSDNPVKDVDAALRWLVLNLDGRRSLVDFNIGKINRYITDNGVREIPGLRIVSRMPPRRKGSRA